MSKKIIHIVFLLLCGLVLIGIGIFFTRNTPLFYYHGLKTISQMKRSQVIYQKKDLNFNRIKLAANLPVEIKAGRQNQIRVVSQKQQHVHVSVHDKKLTVDSTPDKKIRVIHWPGLKPNNHGLNTNYVQITVKQNRILKKLLRLNPDVTGDLTLRNVNFKRLTLMGSGNLDFYKVWSKHQLLINNKSGQINMKLVWGPILNLTTRYGTINVVKSHFKKKPSQIISDSSEINLDLDDWNKLWAKTNEGDINFTHQNSKHLFKALSSDGNIYGRIDYPSVAFMNYYSVNGNVDVFHNLPTDWARYYSFYSDNGDIVIKRGDKFFPTWVRHVNF